MTRGPTGYQKGPSRRSWHSGWRERMAEDGLLRKIQKTEQPGLSQRGLRWQKWLEEGGRRHARRRSMEKETRE